MLGQHTIDNTAETLHRSAPGLAVGGNQPLPDNGKQTGLCGFAGRA
jgi:hypothetical protein